MSLSIHRLVEIPAQRLTELEAAMVGFYKNPPKDYYHIANAAAEHYRPDEQPFHCDLIARISLGSTVLELGCGTAHLCAGVEFRGGSYVGMDHSSELLERNRIRLPKAQFYPAGTKLVRQFDVVASLYTIEHVVNPLAYLEEAWSYCRPGGIIAIISPEFIDCQDLPPSLFFGSTPARLREKVRRLRLIDAARHYHDLKVQAPRWKRMATAESPGAFWMNLKPRVLHGADYVIDADAVHLVRRRDLISFFVNKGGSILQTSTGMPGIAKNILNFNSYVVVRKPE